MWKPHQYSDLSYDYGQYWIWSQYCDLPLDSYLVPRRKEDLLPWVFERATLVESKPKWNKVKLKATKLDYVLR